MTERQAVLLRVLVNTGGLLIPYDDGYKVAAIQFDYGTVRGCLANKWLTSQERDGLKGYVSTKAGQGELAKVPPPEKYQPQRQADPRFGVVARAC